MSQGSLHQFLTGAAAGDAITDQALIIRGWLRDLGFKSELYAQHIQAQCEAGVQPLSAYRQRSTGEWSIYHHSIGSEVPRFLVEKRFKLLLIYHNITPQAFFKRSDLMRAELARLGRQQLIDLRQQVGLALAVSAYNELELLQAGYENTAILPLTLARERYDQPLNEPLAARIKQKGPNLLFVGRLAPNKKQEDLLKLLYYLHRFQPQAQLYLVGDRWEVGYDKWIEALAADLHLGDNLNLTGKVSQQDMVTYYRTADCFVSMSEHEGFGLPLLESMYCSLPVLAFATTGVPYTMGDAGIQFMKKDYEALAELVQLLIEDRALRARIVAGQKERVQYYLEPNVRARFKTVLSTVGLI